MTNKEKKARIRELLTEMEKESVRADGYETDQYLKLNAEVAELEDSLPWLHRAFPTYR